MGTQRHGVGRLSPTLVQRQMPDVGQVAVFDIPAMVANQPNVPIIGVVPVVEVPSGGGSIKAKDLQSVLLTCHIRLTLH